MIWIDRRSLLAGALAAAFSAPRVLAGVVKGGRPSVAITIDDFDLSNTIGMDGAHRDETIRGILRRNGLQAAGFVVGKYVDDAKGRRLLQAWTDDGHIIGNHSYTHGKFTGSDPAGYMADILRCESLLEPFPYHPRLFRFPYLAEGSTAEGRDQMRALLKQNEFGHGYVTIDTSDWYIDQRLRARLEQKPDADIEPFRRYYLDHIWTRARYYDSLAYRVFGRTIPHTLLLHHRLTTALFLNDTIDLFRSRGWHLIDAKEAFTSPVYQIEPASLPAGQSLVWAAAQASGAFEDQLRFPGEDSVYEEPRMAALGL